ncbi:MAG: hypothetical protein GF418_13525 [Chitinivibrionales bacterium]|nr:hypothetical protein [Chitinivibrionales bacterium]MBD3396640.1 hypothetical protein [Chitinivibrionales bacterium]
MLHHLKTFAALALTAAVVSAQMQPVVSGPEGEGNVDWAERTIVATGIGAPNPELPEAAQRPAAMRAAQQIALRNALETVKGIYLNSSTTVQNFMTSSDVITTRVSGYLKGFQQKGRTKYMSDGSVEITMEIPLDGIGNLGDVLYGDQLGEKPSVTEFEGKRARKKQIFTGLIVDCRGLGIKPALSPRVLDSEGREIYGSAYVSKEWAVKYGMVGYAKDVAKAAKLERVGENPGQVKAAKASGDNKTDVVLSDDDAEDIRSAAKNLKFLSECRVIFVVD